MPPPAKLLKDEGMPARSRVAPASISTEFHAEDRAAKPSSKLPKTSSPARMSRLSGEALASWKEVGFHRIVPSSPDAPNVRVAGPSSWGPAFKGPYPACGGGGRGR